MSLVIKQKATDYPIITKSIVSGYIREAQALFNETNNPYYNIPFAINHICLIFYYQSIAMDKNKCGKYIKISGFEENTASFNTDKGDFDASTVYHSNWYHSQWKGYVTFGVKIEKLKETGGLFFGFASSDDIIDNGFYRNKTKVSYSIQSNACLWVYYSN